MRETRARRPVALRPRAGAGVPIDRHYVEHYLRRHGEWPGYAAGDIRGHVLELGSDGYAARFGGEGVERIHVIALNGGAPAPEIGQDRFDCVICAQVLNGVFDVRGVMAALHAALAPGGVLLLTVPGSCPAGRRDQDLGGELWRFTSLAVRRLLEERFDPADVRVEAYGNLGAATAVLHGRGTGELPEHELALRDGDYEVVVAGRAQKRA